MDRPKLQLDLLMDAAIASPNDIAARCALVDCLIEEGMERFASDIQILSHDWDDVSYHGSPIWVCQACGQGERRTGDPVCKGALKRYTKQARDQLDEDYRKWNKLRDEHYEKNRLCRRWGDF